MHLGVYKLFYDVKIEWGGAALRRARWPRWARLQSLETHESLELGLDVTWQGTPDNINFTTAIKSPPLR
ncbi:hypothetical protein LSP04_24100 [Levilactobacillus spicheri]|uniref:Uncharacterized protein n=1 Tax=Levilactobacillus spicheri TaxID=216463 RepID=A0ABQ0WSH9_9LACO|nr:hypothetical protein LSP04_24100 [Levilactobacillus spicheri]